ncbi:HNH endonuclease signature motif containing protein, partial [Monashia sp. NPDC004114]
CRAPGCTVPAHRCDLDHDIPAPHGPTSTDNLSATHRQHHRIRTTGLWTTHRDPDIGTLTWTTATGRTYTTHPKDWLEHHRTPADPHPSNDDTGPDPDEPHKKAYQGKPSSGPRQHRSTNRATPDLERDTRPPTRPPEDDPPF